MKAKVLPHNDSRSVTEMKDMVGQTIDVYELHPDELQHRYGYQYISDGGGVDNRWYWQPEWLEIL